MDKFCKEKINFLKIFDLFLYKRKKIKKVWLYGYDVYKGVNLNCKI